MDDPRLIDMEPGGESTQYESIREFMITPAKQTGQLGGGEPHTKSLTTAIVDPTDSPASGEEDKQAQRLGMGIIQPDKEDLDFDSAEDAASAKARRQQGYGPGSGVGA
ncbi:hypothetical protein N7520_005709 [Penicillium odoratum]|uniref:uncharacterized protein n=1 Tax=Penicillium odoratum TaxID=1167516 RepID=UPI002548D294|nr:uncharacterized protein N7520_005709 [Penicillium odoratum]KAJ5645948.1 hypothetical protein N7490_002320 [Penicillium lividum]KAJ5758553.1 hypothetical protein N7520_005709 [Penicillium odoratum]